MNRDAPRGILARAHAGNRIAGLVVGGMLALPLLLIVWGGDSMGWLTLGPGPVRAAVRIWMAFVVIGFLFPSLPARIVILLDALT
jgi:hypothetical protein